MTAGPCSGEFKLLQQANAHCGEGPIWDWRTGLLYWLDIDRPAAYCFDPVRGEQIANWPLDSRGGLIALASDNRLLVATSGRGLFYLDPVTGKTTDLVHPAAECGPGNYNDGSVDASGRLWAGWITQKREDPGMVFRVLPGGSFSDGIGGIYATNGIGWNAGANTIYFTDSKTRTVFAAPFDAKSGAAGERRVLIQFEASSGIPDGMAVDAAGNIWIALYHGWKIICVDPGGTVVRTVPCPVLNPTSLSFGGPDLDILYVTSAVRAHSADDLVRQPWAGALMSFRPGVIGQPEVIFGGK